MGYSLIGGTRTAFAITYAIHGRVCSNGPVMQGLSVIKARACEDFYSSKALHHRVITTNKGIITAYFI